jgi:hypothetical protein
VRDIRQDKPPGLGSLEDIPSAREEAAGEIEVEQPNGDQDMTTPSCPNCGACGQLRVVLPAVFAVDPAGRSQPINPVPVSWDHPDKHDPAICNNCEWTGEYQDLLGGEQT